MRQANKNRTKSLSFQEHTMPVPDATQSAHWMNEKGEEFTFSQSGAISSKSNRGMR